MSETLGSNLGPAPEHKTMAQPDAPKVCQHTQEGKLPVQHWQECWACCDEVMMQLIIARTYLRELVYAEWTQNGDCAVPVSEPIQGRDWSQVARTALGAIS